MSIEAFVAVMLETTLAGSAAILAVLALRAPLRHAFGAGIAYALWAAVPLAMLAVLLPGDPRPALPAAFAMDVPRVWVFAPQTLADATGATILAGRQAASWLAGLWMLGAATMGAALWRQQRHYRRRLGRLSHGADGVLHAQHALHGPLVLGAWRPQVVVPMDFAQRYPSIQAQLILAHERMHIARGDTWCNLLLAALRCVYWFNPLLHMAAPRFRFDQELACDAAVMVRHPASRRSYAEAMLQTQLDAIALPVGCHWQAAGALRERIALLQRPAVAGWRRHAGMVSVVATVLCGGAAAWALQSPRTDAAAALSEAAVASDAQAGERRAAPAAVPVPGRPPGAAAPAAAATGAATTPMAVSMRPPVYPREALREGASGKLNLLVTVDAAGTPSDVRLLGRGSGNAALDQAAIAAARQWRFVPARAHGRAVSGRVRVPVSFESNMQPVPAPPGLADAGSYRWYLLGDARDAGDRVCDVLHTDNSGPERRLYCGVVTTAAQR